MPSSSTSPHHYPLVKLPHPFLTTYRVHASTATAPAKLSLTLGDQPAGGQPLPQPLHLESLSWLDLTFKPKDECPPLSNNSAWARARRSPQTTFQWTGNSAPSLGQIWNVVHAICLAHPTYEYFRLTVLGAEKEVVRSELLSAGLAIEHPKPWRPADDLNARSEELLVLRSAFWQGAASPTGPRPIWVVGDGTDGPLRTPLSQYPLMPEDHQITMKFPDEPIYTRHPVRRPKPHVGSIAYSRYIPEVDEHFSLEVVDWQNDEHLRLFNTWQNDPRVAKGWNETGTLDQHREYLRRLHNDPHVLCLFGRFDASRFAYYELYWAKVRPTRLRHARYHSRLRRRRTTTARTTTLRPTTAAGTPSSATRPSAARAASTRGTPAASTTASWTIRGRPTSSASPRPTARPSCRTRTRRASSSASTSTWATSARCIRCEAGRSGSSCVRCSGMGESGRWSRQIARPGMRNFRHVLGFGRSVCVALIACSI